jgi:ADP-ribosylglycohydrolase
MTTLPADYLERVYAGVLGKLIGVYSGRPFEGWSHERILAELGEVRSYVNARFDVPLVVTDDDIGGTFAFVRALEDGFDITPQTVADVWRNVIVENRTILWWGGRGVSTEHTAFLNLKEGVGAPESGSIARNGQVVAEQIGAQIFIDGWGLVCPGDPKAAAHLAAQAARVSHDGEAVHAAQVIAAMVAQAFVEPDLEHLLDTGLRLIPADSLIARLIGDLRRWRGETDDWREARRRLEADYGYHRYGGGCHVIPNHGVVVLAWLWGGGDFDQTLMIANTCGWDTDCNAGNVACLMAVRGGLAAIPAAWRDPVADRLYLSTADPARVITDAVQVALWLTNLGRARLGHKPLEIKGGAPFHFSLPGARQGFVSDTPDTLTLTQRGLPSRPEVQALALTARLSAGDVARAMTPTFIPREARNMPGYTLMASPTLYAGQNLYADLVAPESNNAYLLARPVIAVIGPTGDEERRAGPDVVMLPGAGMRLAWTIPDTAGQPICGVGVEISAGSGALYLDRLWWMGAPHTSLLGEGELARRAWINAVETLTPVADEPQALHLVQPQGEGQILQGGPGWKDVHLRAEVELGSCRAWGLIVRATGLRRQMRVEIRGGQLALVVVHDDARTTCFATELVLGPRVEVELIVSGDRLALAVDNHLLIDDAALLARGPAAGAVGVLVVDGDLTVHRLELVA